MFILLLKKIKVILVIFSSGIRKRISLNIDALNKNKKGNEIKKDLESYKRDLKNTKRNEKSF